MKRKRNIRTDSSVRNPGKFLFDFSESESLSGKEYHELMMKAKRFYYEETNDKDLLEEVYLWAKQKYTNKEISLIKRDTNYITANIGVLCKLLRSGAADFNVKQNEYWKTLKGTTGQLKPLTSYIVEAVDKAIANTTEEIVETPTNVINIQDRMIDQIVNLLTDLELEIDKFIENDDYDVKVFDPYTMIRSNNPVVKQPHAAIIKKEFQTLLDEILESNDDEQLKEAYSFLSAKRKKCYIELLEKIITAANMVSEEKKQKVVRKPRKPKAVDKTKLIAKVKYKEKDVELSLVSINPIELIDSQEVWLYNTKQKRLIHLVADELLKTMGVRGTSIVGYDPSNSFVKVVRQADVIRQIKNCTNTQRKKVFNQIKTKPSSATGRINSDTIIVAVKK